MVQGHQAYTRVGIDAYRSPTILMQSSFVVLSTTCLRVLRHVRLAQGSYKALSRMWASALCDLL